MTRSKSKKQIEREVKREVKRAMASPRRPSKSGRLLTSRTKIVIESDGDRDECTWEDFVDANRDMPEFADVTHQLRQQGSATVGGGASPLTVVRLARAT